MAPAFGSAVLVVYDVLVGVTVCVSVRLYPTKRPQLLICLGRVRQMGWGRGEVRWGRVGTIAERAYDIARALSHVCAATACGLYASLVYCMHLFQLR